MNTDITSVLLDQTGLVVKGNDANALTITPNELLTAGRTLNIVTGDADRTLTLTGDASISGTNTGDQTSIVGITGTLAEFNTALTDADFATGGGTVTGTNTGDITIAGEGYLSLVNQVLTAEVIDLSGTNVTNTLPVGKGGTGVATFGGTNTLLYTTAADGLSSIATGNDLSLIHI